MVLCALLWKGFQGWTPILTKGMWRGSQVYFHPPNPTLGNECQKLRIAPLCFAFFVRYLFIMWQWLQTKSNKKVAQWELQFYIINRLLSNNKEREKLSFLYFLFHSLYCEDKVTVNEMCTLAPLAFPPLNLYLYNLFWQYGGLLSTMQARRGVGKKKEANLYSADTTVGEK